MRSKAIQTYGASLPGRLGRRMRRDAGLLMGLVALASFPRALSAAPSPTASQAGINRSADDLILEPLSIGTIERKTTGIIFNRPSEKTAAAQFALAQRHEQARSRRAAIRAYDTLVRAWPHAPEAPGAQLRLADLMEARGTYRRAFEAFRYLVHFYPEQVSLAEILPRMFAIANHTRAEGSASRALTMFEQIAELAPRWPNTAQALLQAGLLQVHDKAWYDAVATFERITANFPGTEEAEAASGQLGHVLHRLSRRYAEDDAVQLRARAALAAALRDYPDHADRDQLQDELTELDARRYQRHFGMAAFYDNRRFTPETAVTAYREFVRRFPNAPQAEEARRRIEALTQTTNR